MMRAGSHRARSQTCRGGLVMKASIMALSLLLMLHAGSVGAVCPAGLALAGSACSFRITQGMPAPWLADGAQADTRAWLGAHVRFDPHAVRGPGVLACGGARYEIAHPPAEGLFQGGLPAPAVQSAQRLGISAARVETLRLSCDSGVFDVHRVDADTALLGVDNVVWTLSHTAGTQAAADAPEAVVQTLLEHHFAGDMGFVPERVADKRRWLDRDLWAALQDWFARPRAADEVPSINGDPFTDSQEYPTRFAVDAARPDDATAEVPVRFADAYRARTVVYHLQREDDQWRVADLLFEDGGRLSDALR